MNTITRRNFVKAAAVLAGGALTGFFATNNVTSLRAYGEEAAVSTEYGALKGQFVVFSDTHLSDDFPIYIARLENAFVDILSFCPRPTSVIVNGDITNNDYESQWETFANIARSAGFSYPDDFTLAMGNHDQIDSSDGDDVPCLAARFMEQAQVGSPYYDRTFGDTHIIVLGPDRYPDNGWDGFEIGPDQLSWLDGLLSADERQGKTSYVFMHEPLYNTVLCTHEGEWGYENSLSQECNDALSGVLNAHANVVYFSGHTHYFPDVQKFEDDGPAYVGTGSVAYTVLPDTDEDGNDDPETYGSTGWLMNVYENATELRLRDFKNRVWKGTYVL